MALLSSVPNFFSSLRPPFAVVGLGLSGRSVLRLLKILHIPDSAILTFDEKAPDAQFADVDKLMEKAPKTLVVSPGVPLSLAWIQAAQKSGVRITNELEIAFSFLQSERVIGVTGSIGKSTTTSLLGAGAKRISKDSFVGGNLGLPLADYVAAVLTGKAQPAPWLVLELSSYQLENFPNLLCDFSILTFLTPNHMERYESLEDYYQCKFSLLKKTKQLAVLNSSGGDLPGYKTAVEKLSRCPLRWVDRNSEVLKKHPVLPSHMIGNYNLDNLALAAGVAEAAGWPDVAFQAMRDFSGLPHRLQNLGSRQGIRFINDSKATTIESVLQAVETVYPMLTPHAAAQKPQLWLLLGGHDKGLPWTLLKKSMAAAEFVRPLFFGEFGAQAKALTELNGPVFPTLALALKELPKLCHRADVVLLSPGGTSHDEFKNFEERGSFFSKQIDLLFTSPA